MPSDGEKLHREFERIAPGIRVMMRRYGYQPMMMVGVRGDGGIWIGLEPEIANRPMYNRLVQRAVVDLCEELGAMAELDDLQGL